MKHCTAAGKRAVALRLMRCPPSQWYWALSGFHHMKQVNCAELHLMDIVDESRWLPPLSQKHVHPWSVHFLVLPCGTLFSFSDNQYQTVPYKSKKVGHLQELFLAEPSLGL